MNIYLDIETIPSQSPEVKQQILDGITAPAAYKKPDSIKQWLDENREAAADAEWRKTSFNGALGHVCSIAVAVDDDDVQCWYTGINEEHSIITRFFDYLTQSVKRKLPLSVEVSRDVVFIGHYISEFDLRFLFQRCVILGIRPPDFIPFNVKPWDSCIYDTMHQWAGIKGRIALNELSKVLGAPLKGDLDGSKVWDYVQAGKIKEVAQYNKDDVERCRIIHKRMTFTGEI